MEIQIKNCNSIDEAKIKLIESKLNIKFAPNGTGKSTIAKALQLGSNNDQSSLSDLMPFKLRKANPENKHPEIIGASTLKNIMCFNEAYVNQFVFKPDELVSNSFDIFIRTEEYKQKEQEIETLIQGIKQLFSGNHELESLISTLKEMGNAFKLSKTGLSKSSAGVKALSGGNKIHHVPLGLESYTPFIQSNESVGWIDWQTKGYEYADMSDNCPFCTSHTADKKEKIRKVGQEYDKGIIKNLISLIQVIDNLGDYFSEDTKESLKAITLLKDGLRKEHEDFLSTVKTRIDTFTGKLESLRTLSAFQFKDGEKVIEKLPTFKLDLQFFSELSSVKMNDAINLINQSIDDVVNKASFLQGKINQQRIEVSRTIEKHQSAINGFLSYAGYRYQVEIAGEGVQSQLKLLHIDHEEHLTGGSQHLSFGEKNAFAIVLFMYECLAKKPDLIILDDPISSFDKNKKFAILEMLFRRSADSCLINKTVLMLTHDVEPIIDTIKSLSSQFGNQTSASFLKLKDGKITEYNIEKNDIQTFSEICMNMLNSSRDDVIKLIYLRRHLEITESKGDAYQVLSNMFKKRDIVLDFRNTENGSACEMEAEKFSDGCRTISKYLSTFSYTDHMKNINNLDALKTLYHSSINGYEKLQIFRLINPSVDNSVLQKFINETYHIENEFICQLDPTKFDTVPEYIVLECDRILNS